MTFYKRVSPFAYKPDGRIPEDATYIKQEGATTGKIAKSIWTDKYGMTTSEKQMHRAMCAQFPTEEKADGSSFKFTEAFDTHSSHWMNMRARVFERKSDITELKRESQKIKADNATSYEPHQDVIIGNLNLGFIRDVTATIKNDYNKDANVVEQAKEFQRVAECILAEAKSRVVTAEQETRSISIRSFEQDILTTEQNMEAPESKMAYLQRRYKKYVEYASEHKDLQYQPYYLPDDWEKEIDNPTGAGAGAVGTDKPPSARKLQRTAAIQNPQHKYEESDEEPSRNKQKVLPSLPECTGKIHAFLKKATAKETFDKIQKFFNTSETTHEMCTLSVVDSRMRGLGLTEEELEVINKLVKECMIGGEVNYVMFTNRMGQSLDPGAYTPDDMWETQPFV